MTTLEPKRLNTDRRLRPQMASASYHKTPLFSNKLCTTNAMFEGRSRETRPRTLYFVFQCSFLFLFGPISIWRPPCMRYIHMCTHIHQGFTKSGIVARGTCWAHNGCTLDVYFGINLQFILGAFWAQSDLRAYLCWENSRQRPSATQNQRPTAHNTTHTTHTTQ